MIAAAVGAVACINEREAAMAIEALTPTGTRPDVAPVLRVASPFGYPAAAWEARASGEVTLRLFLDRTGTPVPESTSVARSSGVLMLDSAALRQARRLRFTPARSQGDAVEVSLLLPVRYRHPTGP
jgi:protein TonB